MQGWGISNFRTKIIWYWISLHSVFLIRCKFCWHFVKTYHKIRTEFRDNFVIFRCVSRIQQKRFKKCLYWKAWSTTWFQSWRVLWDFQNQEFASKASKVVSGLSKFFQMIAATEKMYHFENAEKPINFVKILEFCYTSSKTTYAGSRSVV